MLRGTILLLLFLLEQSEEFSRGFTIEISLCLHAFGDNRKQELFGDAGGFRFLHNFVHPFGDSDVAVFFASAPDALLDETAHSAPGIN